MFLKVGLLGEKLQIYREENLDAVVWSKNGISMNDTLTWYKVRKFSFHMYNEKTSCKIREPKPGRK